MALDTILVPYDDSERSDALLRLACRTVTTRGHIVVVYMVRLPSGVPLEPLPPEIDCKGDIALDRAEMVAAEMGITIEKWLTRVHDEVDAIVGEARLHHADAVFLPLWSWTHPLRRLRGNRTARRVVRSVACPVLVGDWKQGEYSSPSTRRLVVINQ